MSADEERFAEAMARAWRSKAVALRLKRLLDARPDRNAPIEPGSEEHKLTGELANLVIQASELKDHEVLRSARAEAERRRGRAR